MDSEIIAIRDYLILCQTDLYVAVQGINALSGREYTDMQLAIARRGINQAMLKLNVALSKINDKQVILLDSMVGESYTPSTEPTGQLDTPTGSDPGSDYHTSVTVIPTGTTRHISTYVIADREPDQPNEQPLRDKSIGEVVESDNQPIDRPT